MTIPVINTKRAAWKDEAPCASADPEAFFPEKGGSTREAKRVCLRCDVRDKCLEAAITNDERYGVWGGFSERERRKLKQGIAVRPAISNKPNRNANGHGYRCNCLPCIALKESKR